MAKSNDLIKYITQQVVTYMDTPKETRKEARAQHKENWTVRWFGMLPFSMKMTAESISQAGKPVKHIIVRMTDRVRSRKWSKMT